MDLESRFNEIKEFLFTHIEFINKEPLDFFPEGLPSPYSKWTTELEELGPSELVELETNLKSEKLSPELTAYFKKVKSLSFLPQINASAENLKQNMIRGMTEKKRHEVALISGLLKDKKIKNLIDVGSGKGHLSAVLMEHTNKSRSICVDMDPDLQTSGKRRLKEQLPHLTKKISFENASFHKNYRPIKEGSVLSLHSCGDLTVEAMDYALKNNSALINFGCCYHKLTKLNLSTSSKSSPLEFSFKALTLATRSHRILSLEDARRRTKVKRYRYGFHILSHEDGHRTFVPLGNARHQYYEGEFKDYCAKYSPWALKGDINRRFAELENSKALQQYLLTETIRGPLGRLVEVYIALDRALYLKEFGVRAKVGTLFDRALSPRNIMIQIDA